MPCAEWRMVARIEALADGRHHIKLDVPPNMTGLTRACTTRYPLALINAIHATKGDYVCDEIMREEDPQYVERSIRLDILGYLDAPGFAGKRLLDFGCGAGASLLVMSRLLPPSCEIVGVELQERLLNLARLRVELLGRTNVRLSLSPSGTSVPEDLGHFDFIVLSAVYEHLLPEERRALLPLLWKRLRPGGTLFLNQTPHRWSPVETHTTGLPFINYLSDGLAYRFAKTFAPASRVRSTDDWQDLLRAGIRGATILEILDLLGGSGHAALVRPRKEVGDLIDLWHRRLSRRHRWMKLAAWAAFKAIKPFGGIHLLPELNLAIRKR